MNRRSFIKQCAGTTAAALALTECHFAIPGRDRCDVLATWAAGVSYARILNNHQRHGDVLKIATAADFCGTRWQNNALMIPIPRGNGRAYLQPVARVMQLYRHHIGSHSLQITHTPDGLDVAASIRGESVYFHVANILQTRSVRTQLAVTGKKLLDGRVFEIIADPAVELSYLNSSEVMQTRKKSFSAENPWEFPPASVSVVEFKLAV